VLDDQQLTALRILVDRRRSLGEDHTRMISQLHHLLLELIPGGAKKDLSAAQAKALLAGSAHATSPARHGAGSPPSSSATSSVSMPAGGLPTKSFATSSPRPGPA